MNKKDQKFGVLVLAAGNSERMGNPKALLPYNKQLLFYEKIVQEYQKANTDEIVLVCQPEVKNIIEHKAFYLTNNFKLEAKKVADLYKHRWQIEFFFKWIK